MKITANVVDIVFIGHDFHSNKFTVFLDFLCIRKTDLLYVEAAVLIVKTGINI